jgi:hypothetical protein
VHAAFDRDRRHSLSHQRVDSHKLEFSVGKVLLHALLEKLCPDHNLRISLLPKKHSAMGEYARTGNLEDVDMAASSYRLGRYYWYSTQYSSFISKQVRFI